MAAAAVCRSILPCEDSTRKMVATIFTILLAVLGLGPPETHAFIAARHRGIVVPVSAAAIGPLAATATQEGTYIFRDRFKIHAEKSGPKSGQPVLLVHDFGCSTTYWRAAIAALVDAGYRVHAPLTFLDRGEAKNLAGPRGWSTRSTYGLSSWTTMRGM